MFTKMLTHVFLRAAIVSAIAILFLGAGVALAQIEEVIVTAQKRSETSQDVPIALQSISGAQLNKLGVSDAGDIIDLLANVNTNAANELNIGFTIRGVGTNNFHGNVTRAVGVYQDEVFRGTPFSGVLGVFDMERIELLRGPQNALFGRNTTGGAINYISAKPSLDGEGRSYALATVGSQGTFELEGATDINISDTFALRVAGQSVQRDGLFTNLAQGREGEELGERDRDSLRIQGLWKPSESTEILLSYSLGDSDGTNVGNKAIGQRDPDDPSQPCAALAQNGGTSAYTRIVPCVNSFGDNPSTDDWHSAYNVTSAIAEVEVDTGFIKLSHEFNNGIQLTSITAIEQTSVINVDDIAGAPVLFFALTQDADYDQFSQEIRLQGGTDNFRWVGGLYYYQEDLRLATVVRRDANGGVTPPAAPGAGQVAPYNFLSQDDEDISVYGQTEFDLSDNTTLTLGLRYTDNEKRATSIFGVVRAPHLPWGPNDQIIAQDALFTQDFIEQLRAAGQTEAVAQFNVECGSGQGLSCADADGIITQDVSETGGKIGIDHKIANGLLYASFSRGFKTGGFDTRALAALNGDATRPVEEETLNAFEVGYKWQNADRTLRINSAVFLNQWNDQQVFAVVDSIPALTNVPESELFGAEFELTYAWSDNWLINASLGLLGSEITDAGNLDGVSEGHELRNTPSLSMTASVSRDVEIGGGVLNFFAKARYQDESVDNLNFNVGAPGTPVAGVTQDSLHTNDSQFEIDARVTYVFGDQQQYSVALWGNNLTEEQYCNDIGFLDAVDDTSVGALSSSGACSPNDGQALFGITASIEF